LSRRIIQAFATSALTTTASGAKRPFGERTITLEAKSLVDIAVVPEAEAVGLSA
jgi:hypothetical protein